jgi:hypothetical protein
VRLLAIVAAYALVPHALADTFGSGLNAFEIEFVKIGAAGNPPDANPNPAGAVPYEYRIGKYEVSEQMIEKANALGGVGITLDDRGPDFPATSVTWYEAARFVNWLNESTGHHVAYKFDDMGNFQLWEPMDAGYDANNLYRNGLAHYFLPSLNEWHKAAYYDPIAGLYYDYPTGSDAIPDGIDSVGDPDFDAVFDDGADNPGPNIIRNVGLLSPYGTTGQGGNVFEWEETAVDLVNDGPIEVRGLRGGSWTSGPTLLLATNRNAIGPNFQSEIIGFRVVSVVPEPCASLLLITCVAILPWLRIRHRAYTISVGVNEK